VIEAIALSKRFGRTVAVDDLSFRVTSGRVTGFLGPNGAGKSTTLRLLLGLDRADHGEARFDGQRYIDLERPWHLVGSLLDASDTHPSRSARDHLGFLASTAGIPRRRVGEVLDLVGLSEVAGRKVGGFSLGMKQRLGLAAAMLGDPGTVLLDEPANGLDPEGILWIRTFLRFLADQGRTVFVSSHLLGEMAQMADDLVVIGRGRLIASSTVGEFVGRFTRSVVRVRSPDATALAERLRRIGATVQPNGDGVLHVHGVAAEAVGDLAAAHAIVLHELTPMAASLEEAFLEVTRGDVEFGAGRSQTGPVSPPGPSGTPLPPPDPRTVRR
jgi:ABC-2 type transport system ATP-binding protein